jgi:flagellar hook-associated protein 3 FlgL
MPSSSQTRQTLLDLERTNERLALNQTRIATGNRLTGPGDDPSAAASILSFGNSIQANTQYIQQANTAGSYLSSAEDAVTAAIQDNMRLQELAVTGGTASVAEVDSIRANLVSLANTQVQGKYIFAGTQTLGTAAHPLPFDDPTPTTGPIAYWGNTGSINLNVNSTTAVSTNISGDKVFFGSGGQGSSTDIFQAVTDLRNGLSTNNAVLIQKAATSLNTVLDNLNQVEAELGGRQAGLTSLSSTLSGFNVTLQGMQNTLQDTDYPKVATEFSQDQTVQSVTLSALAKTNKTNLFDFLG